LAVLKRFGYPHAALRAAGVATVGDLNDQLTGNPMVQNGSKMQLQGVGILIEVGHLWVDNSHRIFGGISPMFVFRLELRA
jgi:hypothetical protein